MSKVKVLVWQNRCLYYWIITDELTYYSLQLFEVELT